VTSSKSFPLYIFKCKVTLTNFPLLVKVKRDLDTIVISKDISVGNDNASNCLEDKVISKPPEKLHSVVKYLQVAVTVITVILYYFSSN